MGHHERVIPTPDLGDPEPFSYSNCIKVGNLVFLAGQLALDESPDASGDFESQSRQVLERVIRGVEAAGGSRDDIVTMTVYVLDVRKARTFTAIRHEMFQRDFPASTLVEVSKLIPSEAQLEVQAIAVLP